MVKRDEQVCHKRNASVQTHQKQNEFSDNMQFLTWQRGDYNGMDAYWWSGEGEMGTEQSRHGGV